MAVQIEPKLPSYFGAEDSPALEALVGATIIKAGVPKRSGKELPCDRFAIEYRRHGSKVSEVIVFEFSEIGLWVAAE